MKRAIEYLALTAILLSTFFIAVLVGVTKAEQVRIHETARLSQVRSMSCNDALRAGFRIYDPEGFEVESFDGDDYWTTTPKP